MVIVGTMNITRTRERGDFVCPNCRGSQSFRLRSRRPFLTVYFIPVVPVGPAEFVVQCDGCSQNWDPTVLEGDSSSDQEEGFAIQAFRSAIMVVLADAKTTEAEISSLQRIGSRLLQRPVDREELGQMCSVALENKVPATNYVTSVSRNWDHDQRLLALEAMFLAATADGELGDPQIAILSRMKELLGLSDAEYQAAIERAVGWTD